MDAPPAPPAPPAAPAASGASGARAPLWTVALVGVTFVWGATFVIVKEAVERLPVFAFNAWRFAIAALALTWIARKSLRLLGRSGVLHGAVLGVALWSGYTLQTFGLTLTTAAKAAFVTGMFVVFTPLLQAAIGRHPPSRTAAVGAVAAFAGLALLSLEGSLVPTVGDALVLGCALAFALHIVGLGAWSPGRPAAALATVQLAVAAVLHLLGGLVESSLTTGAYPWFAADAYVWVALLGTALLASAFAFTVQTAAQAILSPTRTAVILTLEPVFAWLTAWLGVPLLLALGVTGLVSETFGLREGAGAALILAAMLWTELRAGEPADLVAAPGTGVVLADAPGGTARRSRQA